MKDLIFILLSLLASYFFFGYFTENLGFYIKTKDSDDLTFSEKLEWMRFSWKNR